jgi:hypothetical protein
MAGVDATTDFDRDGQLFECGLENTDDLIISAKKERFQRHIFDGNFEECLFESD